MYRCIERQQPNPNDSQKKGANDGRQNSYVNENTVYLTNKRHLINLLAQRPQQRLEHGKGKNKLPHTDTAAGKRYQMGRVYWVGLSYTL
nr:hypothetical protein [Endozoicomonas acroporae]